MDRRRRGSGCAVGVLLALLLLAAAGAVLGWIYVKRYMPTYEMADKSQIFGVNGNEVALILDNQLQEDKGLYEDGQIYLPVGWVNDHLNQRFYWDAGEELLVYALPDTIVYADASTEGENGPLLKVTSQGAYLSLGLVVNYTDIRTEAFATSQIKRVYIDTQWEPYERAAVRKEGVVRQRGGVRSPVITRAEKDDSLQILSSMEKWSLVRTEDGYMGYIENRRLGERSIQTPVSSFEAPVYTSISMDGKVRLGFHQVTTREANETLEEYAAVARGMNVIVPTWFNVTSSDGTYTSLADQAYVDKAHELGLQVWAMVENVSTQESVKNLDTTELMSSTAKRKALIENLMQEAEAYGLDGFNLDFESLRSEAGPHYIQFIRELSVSCRQKGLVLSVDNYVPSEYTAFYNRKEQGIVADYVIVMGYDEHYAGGEAGSVASISFVKEGIENSLKEVPKEKLVNSVPFYTRVWTEKDGTFTSRAYGIAGAKAWVEENDVHLEWQEDLGQYYGETENEDGLQRIWMEEERSLGLKMDLINEYDLAGVACWKLGFETTDIWDIISNVE